MHQDRITGDYNDFWAGRDYLNQIDDMKAALLMAHAFNDWNVMPEHSVRIYEAAQGEGRADCRSTSTRAGTAVRRPTSR